MPFYECERCDTAWPLEYVKEWGRSKESDGMGKDPMCTMLVPSESAPPAKDTMGRVVKELPLEVCRGMLVRREDAGEDRELLSARLQRITPIEEGRRA